MKLREVSEAEKEAAFRSACEKAGFVFVDAKKEIPPSETAPNNNTNKESAVFIVKDNSVISKSVQKHFEKLFEMSLGNSYKGYLLNMHNRFELTIPVEAKSIDNIFAWYLKLDHDKNFSKLEIENPLKKSTGAKLPNEITFKFIKHDKASD